MLIAYLSIGAVGSHVHTHTRFGNALESGPIEGLVEQNQRKRLCWALGTEEPAGKPLGLLPGLRSTHAIAMKRIGYPINRIESSGLGIVGARIVR